MVVERFQLNMQEHQLRHLLLRNWSDFKNQWNGIRNFYVAWNIFNINAFYSNYYNAISDASQIATDNLGTIITIIDPVQDTNVFANDLLTALSVGLAFIPEVEGEAQITKAIVTASEQVVEFGKFMFPVGTAGGEADDWNAISGSLGTVTNNLQASVTSAQALMQSDVESFLALVGSGAFSTILGSLDNLKEGILAALYTYLVSEAYKSKGVFISRQFNTDVHALQTNGTSLNWDTHCEGVYDSNGVCDTFWYDNTTGTTYGLVNGPSVGQDFNSDMEALFGTYTTGAQLFQNAVACLPQGSGAPILNLNSASFSATCISSLPVYCDDATVMPGRGKLCNGAMPGGKSLNEAQRVPPSYLGWGILNNKATQNTEIDLSTC
ncbi:hypothetical protein G7Y89_g9378 [Cudoniella acicularis]|uniref:Uncharacterized protein n=1 Tax=Cudoniella acicularis TaxID=354080 RepID=A0A8H4RES3_9HELO|nr:hypothetical protein G7Y89_g9378 [Cudoniella acicularis]